MYNVLNFNAFHIKLSAMSIIGVKIEIENVTAGNAHTISVFYLSDPLSDHCNHNCIFIYIVVKSNQSFFIAKGSVANIILRLIVILSQGEQTC